MISPIIRRSVANVFGDKRTHLLWLVSRSVVDTLYWTETVTTSRLNVVDGADVVWVLVWLVVYSRGVVYVTELISVTESKRVKKKCVRGLLHLVPSRGGDGTGGRGGGGGGGDGCRAEGTEGKGTGCEACGGGNIYACVGRQIFTRA